MIISEKTNLISEPKIHKDIKVIMNNKFMIVILTIIIVLIIVDFVIGFLNFSDELTDIIIYLIIIELVMIVVTFLLLINKFSDVNKIENLEISEWCLVSVLVLFMILLASLIFFVTYMIIYGVDILSKMRHQVYVLVVVISFLQIVPIAFVFYKLIKNHILPTFNILPSNYQTFEIG